MSSLPNLTLSSAIFSLTENDKRIATIINSKNIINENLMEEKEFRRENCENCAFFLSTGFSNKVNFPSAWFPFYGINSNDWIIKARILGNNASAIARILKSKSLYTIEVREFLNRFDFWWQVQLSLALHYGTNEVAFWTNNPEFEKFVKENDYENKKFIKREKEIEPLFIKPVQFDIFGRNKINEWLSDNKALCLIEI